MAAKNKKKGNNRGNNKKKGNDQGNNKTAHKSFQCRACKQVCEGWERFYTHLIIRFRTGNCPVERKQKK